MAAKLDQAVADPKQTIAELQRQLAERTAERDEALDQQTATAQVLQVINSSPGDLAPVFDAILEKAMRLCGAVFGSLATYDGELFHSLAFRGMPRLLVEVLSEPYRPIQGSFLFRLVNGEPFGQALDLAALPQNDDAHRRGLVDLGGARSTLWMALRKEDALHGMIAIYRQELRPFSEKEIALLESYAAQAVIAMENSRLITEAREALEQQTATAEVLQVISSSPGDLSPVFDAMLEKAMHLCGAAFGELRTYDGERVRTAAIRGVPAAFAEYRRHNSPAPGPASSWARILGGERVVNVADLMEEDAYRNGEPNRRAIVDLGGARSALAMALTKDDAVVGFIQIYRQEVRPFSDKQIALLQNFAAQAVIAMENARLITETREALDQQTATAQVLQVINSSPGDLAPVFDAMLEKAMRLCEAAFGVLFTFDGTKTRHVAQRGVPASLAEFLREPVPLQPGGAIARLASGEAIVQMADISADEAYRAGNLTRRAFVDLGGARAAVWVPMRKEGAMVGGFVIYRREARPFSDKQIALLQSFAAQAVIAMENARLITETKEALDQQTATAEVLQVINSSPGDLAPVFGAMVDKALGLCEASFGGMHIYDGEQFQAVAHRGVPAPLVDYLRRPQRPGPGTSYERLVNGEAVVHVPDISADDVFRSAYPGRVAMVELGGARTAIWVALRRSDTLLGAFVIYRREVRPFSEKQIALLQNFAAQAVIAIENARLITATREARDDAEGALRQLKAAQASLIQAEKMASLGQLTAGIAHEIKNPLNFVNNFASLSVELLEELKEATEPAVAALGDAQRAAVGETIDLLSGNLEKIADHGKRADNIVKSMLEHSRGVTGERREVDLNALIEEALNLAYHGARAQDQGFNITLERDYASALRPIEVAPQEITRVFLNIFGNGFYAANKRAQENGDVSFRPSLAVATHEAGGAVEVRVRDNGTGIPSEIKDKLFQPFFTTKPTGEGTGLGLSISYDIVTQQHGGTIEVDSEEGVFTEFRIRLPRTQPAAAR